MLAGVFYTTTRLRAAPEKLQRMKYDWAIRKVRRGLRQARTLRSHDKQLTLWMCGLTLSFQHVLFTEGKVR